MSTKLSPFASDNCKTKLEKVPSDRNETLKLEPAHKLVLENDFISIFCFFSITVTNGPKGASEVGQFASDKLLNAYVLVKSGLML